MAFGFTEDGGMCESETQQQQQKQKREGDSDDSNLIAKKSKIEKVNEDEEEKEAARAQIMHKQIDFVEIEADAAEDKGSRHTMEDASVVLLDAFPGSPPNLRLTFLELKKKLNSIHC